MVNQRLMHNSVIQLFLLYWQLARARRNVLPTCCDVRIRKYMAEQQITHKHVLHDERCYRFS